MEGAAAKHAAAFFCFEARAAGEDTTGKLKKIVKIEKLLSRRP